MLALSASEIRPWPHIALLLESLGTCDFFVTECAPVIQSAFGQHLVWSPRDWIDARLRLIDIYVRLAKAPYVSHHEAQRVGKQHIGSWSFIRELVLWRVIEPQNFKLDADTYLRSQFDQLDIHLPRLNPVFLAVKLLTALGDTELAVTLRIVGKGGARARWRSQTLHSDQDAVVRGL